MTGPKWPGGRLAANKLPINLPVNPEKQPRAFRRSKALPNLTAFFGLYDE